MNTSIGNGALFVLLISFSMMTGCAKDRVSTSACCGSSTTFSQNYSPNQESSLDVYRPVANDDSTASPSGNVVQNKVCPVTGEPVDTMGGAIPVLANGYEISVCCQGCVSSVQKDPAKFLAIAQSQNNGKSNYQTVSYGDSCSQSGKCH